METKHNIVVNNKRGIQFKFTINRKFTVIRGNSATGKTTLWQMVSDANSSNMSGITISCDVPLKTLNADYYVRDLEETQGNIYIIDEDFPALRTKEFARSTIHSNNCFIIITRESMATIPYSYKEIYSIKISGKFHSLERVYSDYEILHNKETVYTEDEDAGLEYYQEMIGKHVQSAHGNSNLSKYGTSETLLIGDGSAIGPFMADLMVTKAELFLPESFEYLLLQSPLFDNNNEIKQLFEQPEHFISAEYASWERFFTEQIIKITNNTPAQYQKSTLNECFYKDCCCKGKKCEFFTRNNKCVINMQNKK